MHYIRIARYVAGISKLKFLINLKLSQSESKGMPTELRICLDRMQTKCEDCEMLAGFWTENYGVSSLDCEHIDIPLPVPKLYLPCDQSVVSVHFVKFALVNEKWPAPFGAGLSLLAADLHQLHDDIDLELGRATSRVRLRDSQRMIVVDHVVADYR